MSFSNSYMLLLVFLLKSVQMHLKKKNKKSEHFNFSFVILVEIILLYSLWVIQT